MRRFQGQEPAAPATPCFPASLPGSSRDLDIPIGKSLKGSADMGQHKPHGGKKHPAHPQNGSGGWAGEPAAAWQGRSRAGPPGGLGAGRRPL